MKKRILTTSIRAADLTPVRTVPRAGTRPLVLRFMAKTLSPKISASPAWSLARRSLGVRPDSPLAFLWRRQGPKQCGWSGVSLSAPLRVRPCRRVIPVSGFAESRRRQPVTIHFANHP